MAKRGRPRKGEGLPPNLAESPEQLARDADELEGAPAQPTRDRKARSKAGPRAAERAPAPEPVQEIPFPVEAIALLHLELWNALSERLRSRYRLSERGAAEMATYADVCIRQYLGPYLREHMALSAYLMTQAAALLSLMAMRETPKKPEAPAPSPLAPVAEPQYHPPVTETQLRVPA